MLIPVRCFTCNKVLGNKWRRFKAGLRQKKPVADVLDEMGLRRYCCRQILISNFDLLEDTNRLKTCRRIPSEKASQQSS